MTAKKCTKRRDARAKLLFCLLILWRSRSRRRRRRRILRSLNFYARTHRVKITRHRKSTLKCMKVIFYQRVNVKVERSLRMYILRAYAGNDYATVGVDN